ncbi:MAG TPA: prolipoprotein diacylglyceryl transferase family protein [Verrucomicrobiae bacterium]|nr:prolipoprotein diacylglyceryl transferase family protein [Verrucomicrobiae bacterium]
MIVAPYGWLTLGGLLLSFVVWTRLARNDPRLLTIYLAGLFGALVGAKIVYFCAEGYLHLGASDMWRHLATGKSILGGLLGGYAGVEAAKRFLGYRRVTGDRFALIVPAGVLLGRIGCWTSGCCQGIEFSPAWFTVSDSSGHARWPAVPVEMAFNLVFLALVFALKKTRRLEGQHFHLYLVSYGAMRFVHEFVRDEPRVLGPFSGYQVAALAVVALGLWRFRSRSQERQHDSESKSRLVTDAQLELQATRLGTNRD